MMKESNRAPAYACIYHGLAEIAREYGYALAIHGSVLTDLDLIAVPWTDDAVDAESLMMLIRDHCGKCAVNLDEYSNEHIEPSIKPHGRLAWKFHLHAGGAVDLSVLPRRKLCGEKGR
jgi:hypothetical protein